MNSTPNFLGPDFLLENEFSSRLYHEYAEGMPIIDYHNHLSPHDINSNRQFQNLTELWLDGDHYKWRAMRTNGVPEKYCTGDAPPFEKFVKWAETMPYAIRNPLYHWSHLELKNYFGINELLSPATARTIYSQCGALLLQEDFKVRGLLNKMKVEVVCTTDDPVDSLTSHQQLAQSDVSLRMLPTFRPDKVYAFSDPVAYSVYLERISAAAGIVIERYDQLLEALEKRIDFFHQQGCRVSDHGLELLPFVLNAEQTAAALFHKVRNGSSLSDEEQQSLRAAILIQLSKMYHQRGWVQQFHLGALRNNSSRKLRELGPDSGFDSIGDFPQARSMSQFFNFLDNSNQLTKTIIYNLNPADNEVFATMIGNFNDGSIAGKIQWGSGWWFLDQKDGMEKQLNTLSNLGLLSRFVGMVTDSRSFLSFPRHEYFRRILCNLIGKDMAKGELPHDLPWMGKIVQDICYHNSKNYFGF
ncbi:MAG: glucuronate isomerase [Bacteroidetes bacterium]|nr:glucuronate isomerase [Bacteroidota bacterium]